MKVSTLRLHTPGLKSNIVQAIEALIAYAEQHKDRRVHDMQLPEFCRIAGFPLTTTQEEVIKLMSQTRKATASIRITETSPQKKIEILAGSWPVFNFVFISHAQISFEICEYMWEEFPTYT
ncbi:MAG TPA: hypothetical protein VJ577_07550 [Burkholderiaceae bacterium]|nr:hypothetical protein [Burkholderiaceae bacterium]